jgi:Fic family protein
LERFKKETYFRGDEGYENIVRLKIEAEDGKIRETEVVDTKTDYQKINDTSDRTASRDLENLVSINIFKRIGKKRGAYYELENGGNGGLMAD